MGLTLAEKARLWVERDWAVPRRTRSSVEDTQVWDIYLLAGSVKQALGNICLVLWFCT